MTRKTKLIIIIVVISLVFPVSIYVYKFGLGLWSSQSEWAEFGSYIGGVYAPILSALTLLFLCTQIFLQGLQHKENLAIQQESLLYEYIKELDEVLLLNIEEGVTFRNYLNALFRDKDMSMITEIDAELIMQINQENHKIYSMWFGVICCLNALKGYSEMKNMKSPNYAIQKNRVVAHLDPQVCRSLDKFNYAFSIACKKNGISVEFDDIHYSFWDVRAGA